VHIDIEKISLIGFNGHA
jgi:hypothetical protein